VTGLRAVDTQSSWFWDRAWAATSGYSREWMRSPGKSAARLQLQRVDDLHAWSNTNVVLAPDEGDAAFTVRPLMDPDISCWKEKEMW